MGLESDLSNDSPGSASPAAKSEEKIRVAAAVDNNNLSAGKNDFEFENVVNAKPMAIREKSMAAALKPSATSANALLVLEMKLSGN
jgi:hypothetical protein